MRKGFLIYEEMHKYFPIYEEAVSHMTLQLLFSEFPYIWGKFYFLFYRYSKLFNQKNNNDMLWHSSNAFFAIFMWPVWQSRLAPRWSFLKNLTTVKRPKFDILFGENIFFLLNLFRWPPLKLFGGVSKIQVFGKMKWKIWFSHCKVAKKTLFCRCWT